MKVLIAVDHSDFARAITDFVVNHVWPDDTQFTVLSVVTPPKVGTVLAVLPGPILDTIEKTHFETAFNLVKNTVKAIAQKLVNCQVKELVVPGFPKEEIIQIAKDQKVDMIILGSHGRNDIERAILGSVSMAVLTHAPCSVAIIRAEHLEKLDPKAAAEVALGV
jgi:nucleotide-binding universal stress UspA family protein